MRIRLLSLLCCLLIGADAFSQMSISGKVVDESGVGLPGVNVTVKGMQVGALTNIEGLYSVEHVPGGAEAVLIFSYVGFERQEVLVGNRKIINVKMKEDRQQLDEVVVVGYGTSRKKDLSGSIASMKMEDSPTTQLANVNALSALSSKIAGFDYSPSNSAGADNSSSMTIRGMNSVITSTSEASLNRPLLVVDGSIYKGSINEISLTDIESIDVLKDASSAAIYGSRSANGVIIITTKRGKNSKPTINLDAYYGFQTWSRKPQMVTDEDTFLRRRRDAKIANGLLPAGTTEIDPAQLLNSEEYSAYQGGQWVNWIDEVTQSAPIQNYNISISGNAGADLNYYLSSGYMNQQGILDGDEYSKLNFLGKIDTKITKWLTIGGKVSYYRANRPNVTPSMQSATWMSPYSYTHVRTAGYEDWIDKYPDGTSVNPFWGTAAGSSAMWTDYDRKNNNLNGTGYLQIDFPFIKGLTYKFTMNGVYNTANTDYFTNPQFWLDTRKSEELVNIYKYSSQSGGRTTVGQTNAWTMDNVLTYNHDFKLHHVDAMVGYTRDASDYTETRTEYTGFTVPTVLGFYGQNLATTQKINKELIETQNVGYMARLNYNYDNKYYVAANFRRDGFSGFASGNKWANFPGISVAWTLSKEKFMKGTPSWLNFLKLRGSYGHTGNQSISAYATLAQVASGYTAYGSTSSLYLYQSSLPNTELTWATTKTGNFGIDFSTLEDRLSGTMDIYNSTTTDMLLTRSLPYNAGQTSIKSNAGKVSNKGLEITLNSVNVNGNGKESVRWESGLVFYQNKNKLVHLFGKGIDGIEANDVGNAVTYGYETAKALVIGESINAAWDMKKLGIFQSQEEIDTYVGKDGNKIQPTAVPGDIKFLDYNEDGKISDSDRHCIGDMDPLFTVNFSNTLSWKNFSFYFNFRWNAGNSKHYIGSDPYGNYHNTATTNGAQLKAEPWSESNHTDKYPRLGYANSLSYNFWSQRDFLKLKDITLSYTFDQPWVKKANLQKLRLYLSGTDLFTVTGWSGLDPENGGTIAAGPSSSRYGSTPVFRSFTIGANITF